MPFAINQNLMSAFKSYTTPSGSTPGVVSPKEARDLISMAIEINAESRGCCGFGKKHKGADDLEELLKQYPGKFMPGSSEIINFWLKNKRLPQETEMHPTPETTPSTTPPVSIAPVVDPVAEQEVKIGSWKCKQETWHCHWFPMQARTAGGDPINNLYAKGGALEKYDQAFGTKSCEYELAHHFQAHDADRKKFGWWGHCNYASEVACLLQKPTQSVVRNGVTFTPHAISGLLVKVIPSLVKNVGFNGDRYNGPSDDPADPKPSVFLTKVLQPWGYQAKNPAPFVLDVDRKEMVWNYPFDQGEVYESNQPPAGFDSSALPAVPAGGKIKYYRAELSGTDFSDQKQSYRFWLQYDEHDKMMEGGQYFKVGPSDDDSNMNPDFAWKSEANGDLTKSEFWVTNQHAQNNPHVRAEDVYSIYMESIGRVVAPASARSVA
jgi:hypothetical protein